MLGTRQSGLAAVPRRAAARGRRAARRRAPDRRPRCWRPTRSSREPEHALLDWARARPPTAPTRSTRSRREPRVADARDRRAATAAAACRRPPGAATRPTVRPRARGAVLDPRRPRRGRARARPVRRLGRARARGALARRRRRATFVDARAGRACGRCAANLAALGAEAEVRPRATRCAGSAAHPPARANTISSSSIRPTGGRRRWAASCRRRCPRCWRPGALVVSESDRRAPLELTLPRHRRTPLRRHPHPHPWHLIPPAAHRRLSRLLRPDHERPRRRHHARRGDLRRADRRASSTRPCARTARCSRPRSASRFIEDGDRAICRNVRVEHVRRPDRRLRAPRRGHGDRQGAARDLRLRVRAGDEPAQPPPGRRHRVRLPHGRRRSTVSCPQAESRRSPPSAATSRTSSRTRSRGA